MDLQTQFSLAQSQVKLSMQMVLFIMGQWSGTNSNMFPFSLYCQGPQDPALTSRPPQVPESAYAFHPNSLILRVIILQLILTTP